MDRLLPALNSSIVFLPPAWWGNSTLLDLHGAHNPCTCRKGPPPGSQWLSEQCLKNNSLVHSHLEGLQLRLFPGKDHVLKRQKTMHFEEARATSYVSKACKSTHKKAIKRTFNKPSVGPATHTRKRHSFGDQDVVGGFIANVAEIELWCRNRKLCLCQPGKKPRQKNRTSSRRPNHHHSPSTCRYWSRKNPWAALRQSCSIDPETAFSVPFFE